MESLSKHRRSLSHSEPYSALEPSLARSFSHSRWKYGNPTVVSVILDIQPAISTIGASVLFGDRLARQFFLYVGIAIAAGILVSVAYPTQIGVSFERAGLNLSLKTCFSNWHGLWQLFHAALRKLQRRVSEFFRDFFIPGQILFQFVTGFGQYFLLFRIDEIGLVNFHKLRFKGNRSIQRRFESAF